MIKMTPKRMRSENFSTAEKLVLVKLVKTYKQIVENKKTDSKSLKLKEEAWEQIAFEYNSHSNLCRTVPALRTCWDNLKRKSRRAQAEERRNTFKTGGGQHINVLRDPILSQVSDVLRFPLRNSYDSDATYNEGLDKSVDSAEVDEESDEENNQKNRIVHQKVNRSQWRSKVLKAPFIAVLKNTSFVHAKLDERNRLKNEQREPSEEEIMTSSCQEDDENTRAGISGKSVSPDKDDALVEAQLELAKMAKAHAIAEEARKIELHDLLVKKTKLEIEILHQQLEKNKGS